MKERFNKIKWISLAVLLPIVVVYLWYSSGDKPLNELLLILAASETEGLIIEAKQFDDVAETNDGRTVEYYEYYILKYAFKSNKRKIFYGYTKRYGTIPEEYQDLGNNPVMTTIEYLTKRPGINRMQGEEDSPLTVGQWVKKRAILFILGLTISIAFSIYLFKVVISKSS